MPKNQIASLMILLESLIFGVTFVVIKEGLANIEPLNFLAWRFILGAIVLALICHKKLKSFDLDKVKLGAAVGLVLAVAQSCQTLGIQYSTASKSAFITNLCVVLVPVFLAIKAKEMPKPNIIVSVILASSGLALLTLENGLSIGIGDILLFICAIFFALYIILVGKYSRQIDAISFTTYQLSAVAISCLFAAIFTGEFSIPQNYLAWQSILFCAVFATAAVHVIQNHFQQYISETTTAIIFASIPLFATIAAFFYLGEQITLKTIIGGTLVITAMVLAESKSSQSSKLIADESLTRS